MVLSFLFPFSEALFLLGALGTLRKRFSRCKGEQKNSVEEPPLFWGGSDSFRRPESDSDFGQMEYSGSKQKKGDSRRLRLRLRPQTLKFVVLSPEKEYTRKGI